MWSKLIQKYEACASNVISATQHSSYHKKDMRRPVIRTAHRRNTTRTLQGRRHIQCIGAPMLRKAVVTWQTYVACATYASARQHTQSRTRRSAARVCGTVRKSMHAAANALEACASDKTASLQKNIKPEGATLCKALSSELHRSNPSLAASESTAIHLPKGSSSASPRQGTALSAHRRQAG